MRLLRKFVWTWAQIIMGADPKTTRRKAGAKFRKSRAAKRRESEQAELRG